MGERSTPRPGIDYWPDGHIPERTRLLSDRAVAVLRVLVFCGMYVALQSLWQSTQGGPIEQWVVADATVFPAALWVDWLTPDLRAYAIQFSIRAASGGPGINVLNGCEGLEVLFLLWAALVVSGLPWRWQLIGLLLGTPLVWLLNQMRVVSLFYANRADKDLFALLHGTVAPLLLITLVGVAFLLFMRLATSATPEKSAPTSSAGGPHGHTA